MSLSPLRIPSRLLGVTIFAAMVIACATSPTGRTQLLLMDRVQMADMGKAAFVQMQGEVPKSNDAAKTGYVRCVANAIVSILTPTDLRGLPVSEWEVELFDDESANAFALPGGRIGVNTGLLDVAVTPDQLATVLGHEVGHVLAQHGNARVSNSQLAQTGMSLASVFIGGETAQQQQLMGLLGMGVEFGVLKPFGRADESEADIIGLKLMARAGFDPRQSIPLWQNMARASAGQAPPEFMSTHPSHATRITELQAQMSEALPLYEQARASGRRPDCR
jgi:predicted Zn-dependent protease